MDESGMPKGSAPGSSASATGGIIVSAPDGVGSIVINGVTVWTGGALVASELEVPNGKLTVGYDAATGVLSYTYTLTQADQHNVADATGSADQVAHEILVSVTDSDGDVGQGVIRVEVGDDGPSLVVLTPEATTVADQGHTISGTLAFTEGADGVKNMTVTVEGDGEPQTFTGVKNEDGTWSFKDSNGNATDKFTYSDATKGFMYTRPTENSDGEANDTIKFSATVTDADGDKAASSEVTVSTIAPPIWARFRTSPWMKATLQKAPR